MVKPAQARKSARALTLSLSLLAPPQTSAVDSSHSTRVSELQLVQSTVSQTVSSRQTHTALVRTTTSTNDCRADSMRIDILVDEHD